MEWSVPERELQDALFVGFQSAGCPEILEPEVAGLGTVERESRSYKEKMCQLD